MGALTADFNTSRTGPATRTRNYIAATGAVMFKGGMVSLNAAGLAIRAATGAALGRVCGVLVSKSLDGTEAAGQIVTVEEGSFVMNQVTTKPVQANVGTLVYAQTDNEVNKDATGLIAGVLESVNGTTDCVVRIDAGTPGTLASA